MAKTVVLFNSYSNNNKGNNISSLLEILKDKEVETYDVTKESFDYRGCLLNLQADDEVYLCGGDGTLNFFINKTKGLDYKNKIYYFPTGTGNDFYKDVKGSNQGEPVEINEYLVNLPSVIVNGEEHLFINGVGYGIDGYCCEVGDKMRAENKGKINYTTIAIKGLLFHYKPTNAVVIVDGKQYEFKKVWIAPSMHGRYYGGGMIPTPNQTRKDDKISIMIFHGSGKLRTLTIFPSLFKGEHVKHTKYVTVLSGKEIYVKFDEPRSIQIDGETILAISEYKAHI